MDGRLYLLAIVSSLFFVFTFYFSFRIKRHKVEIHESSIELHTSTSQGVEAQTSGNSCKGVFTVHVALMMDRFIVWLTMQLILACQLFYLIIKIIHDLLVPTTLYGVHGLVFSVYKVLVIDANRPST